VRSKQRRSSTEHWVIMPLKLLIMGDLNAEIGKERMGLELNGQDFLSKHGTWVCVVGVLCGHSIVPYPIKFSLSLVRNK